MRTRRWLGYAVAAVMTLSAVPAGVASVPQQAYACSKGEITTPEYDYSTASHVFYGMVNKVENVYFNGQMYRMATFVVDAKLKGEYVRTVLTRPDSDQCGMAFEAGRSYLVYANNRLGPPSASVFDVFSGDEAARRLEQAQSLIASVPVPEPGEQRVTLYPGTDATITLDGQQAPVKPGSLFYKNILYVPLTFFRDTLGYVTVWNAEANRYDILLRSEWAGIAAQGDQAQSAFKADSKGIPAGTEPFEATVTYSNVQARVDGGKYAPEHLPFTYDGVVFVPLRETAEKLGIQVTWDPGSYTAMLKDIRPIHPMDHPVLVMKLSSDTDGVPDLIVDRIENDQATYRVDRKLQYGEKPEQLSAPFLDLVKETDGARERRIRLFLKSGDRENELVMTEDLMHSLLTNPLVRTSASLTLGRDFFYWPDDYVIGTPNIH
ncbi:stalk domain-containing protein [Paenibacillus rigui]|uniref:Copper amine oxidase-like N-terminal domain-containing protein n=1 Tax=Paenibacillus rigui TaxID=554312 RepID=A0A229UHH8_9BACL|nr:stalk domain-containing protein [Paenibacillus rigui]OXM82852.1 hypothetical protein CF651_28860 [Paenibacillus rigui]